jgi:late competence protein required for DNA uptake (superfamily II DNA/RNA helicase)
MKCPKCGSEDVSESWKIGYPDKFYCRNCKAKWVDGHEEKMKEYTWDQIKPDDAGDYIEIRPGVFVERVKEGTK